MESIVRDVVVIGAGGAGLSAAITAKENGADVLVITKEYPTRSQTSMAQGGINAAIGGDDTIEEHIANTLKAAHGMADEQAVRFMCESAPDVIGWLDSIGVCFSRTKGGAIAQRRLGGASVPRACYAQDYTGLKILHTLYDKALSLGIEFVYEHTLLEILQDDEGKAAGAMVLDIRSGERHIFQACSVILASGGYSRIYDTFSTNSTASSGDGIAAALRAGAKPRDMEFVQFHPTALKNSAILISESARGEGGYLLNSKGERFVNELAPRDEVSRAIDAQIQQGENIFLDIRHLGEAFIENNLPQERKLAMLYENVDPANELIPIKPVAHYTMGGIEVDHTSQTSLIGLFACGECANHRVHGANRLGGNSLLEIVVFGKEAGDNAVKYAKRNTPSTLKIKHTFLDDVAQCSNEIDFYEKRRFMGELLYKNVGIVRTKEKLLEAQKELEQLAKQIPMMGVSDSSKIYNTNRVEFVEFTNMVAIAKEVIKAALIRNESCGAHYMERGI